MESSVGPRFSGLNPSQQAAVEETLRQFWGYDQLRPLQGEAIAAGLNGRDSLVVLPTGGGKSLCYQVPPAILGGTHVVVSPLISLMKDQLDSLRACGYPATALHSGISPTERDEAERGIAAGEYRLVFVAPERLVNSRFLDLLRRQSVGSFSIDEAHCISHWGHNFRPEYRQLAILKNRFPGTSVHAFTATATGRVRDDIVEQLRLDAPEVLVGTFDRPNLTYRIVPRHKLRNQVVEVVERHHGEALIIYCISRSDTERLSKFLQKEGYRADCYHAGLEAESRRRVQDAFSNESLDIIVATVAFGMGVDRSDVRCVIHAAMPKSIEHYQQETGRAGRDGLEAECVLFYSPADTLRWRKLLERANQDDDWQTQLGDLPPDRFVSARQNGARQELDAGVALLDHMRKFVAPGNCRHKTLSEYFGQSYETDNCDACDICLGECEDLEDGTAAAQKILSCVFRVQQQYGIAHIADVLRGMRTDRVVELSHDRLSTFGLMSDTTKTAITNMVYQLVDQDLVTRTDSTYPVLQLNQRSAEVLRGEREVWLVPQRKKKASVTRTAHEQEAWEGVDRNLFEHLRDVRLHLARERGVPPFVIFGDATLRHLASAKPTTPEEFLDVHGVGAKKLADFGEVFLGEIAEYGGNTAAMQNETDHTHDEDLETNAHGYS